MMPVESQSHRGRIILIFGLAALVVAGGAYYLFAVYLPKQKQGPAQDEIARWEGRLAAARACLLGESPGSSNTREALAIRELSPDPWNRSTCTSLIGKLSRGETEDTGLAEVEESWRQLDRAAGVVAAAFLAHVDPQGEPYKNRVEGGLALGLDALDLAHAELRAAAGLPPPDKGAASPPLPAVQVVPVRDGTAPVTTLDRSYLPSMNSLVAFTVLGDHTVQLTFTAGAAPVVKIVGPTVVRSYPDSGWGAGGGESTIPAGTIDRTGFPPDEGDAKDAIKLEHPRVFAVAGTADSGFILGGNENEILAIRSKAGKLTAGKPIVVDGLSIAHDPAGRVLVSYNAEAVGSTNDSEIGYTAHALIARNGDPVAFRALGAFRASTACLTAKRGWLGTAAGDQALALDDAAHKAYPLEGYMLIGCSADAALLHKPGTARYQVCTDACRDVGLPIKPSSLVALVGDRAVGILVRDRVLGVWREQGPPRYFALPKQLTPRQAMSDGKVIDIVAETGGGIELIRVPAQ